ncbi:unnamed protein product [Tilletia controversa]|nr:unnamed protein product [Tilletia controversa]
MSTPAQKTREERLEELSRLRTQQTETPSDEERDRKQKEAIEALLKMKEDQKRKDKERRERRRTIHQLEKELNPSGSRQSSSSGESDQTTSTRARGSTSASSAKRIGDLESKNQSLEQELQQLRLGQGRQLSQPSSDSTVHGHTTTRSSARRSEIQSWISSRNDSLTAIRGAVADRDDDLSSTSATAADYSLRHALPSVPDTAASHSTLRSPTLHAHFKTIGLVCRDDVDSGPSYIWTTERATKRQAAGPG